MSTSGDLISRSALLEKINSCKYDTVNREKRTMERIVRAHICELIEKQPVAYDEAKTVDQITKARDVNGLVYYVDGRPVICKEQAIEIIKGNGRGMQQRYRKGGKDGKY